MRVRIELRRYGGIFIPRFRPSEGVRGILLSRMREVEGRLVVVMFLGSVEPAQGCPAVPTPELFAPTVIEFLDDSFRVGGFEVVGRCHHAQQWDVYPLPEAGASLRPRLRR